MSLEFSASRLRRIRRHVQRWARSHEPSARWINATQLEFPSGAVLDITNLAISLALSPKRLENEIIADYLEKYEQSRAVVEQLEGGDGEFSPETIMTRAVKMFVPAETVGELSITRIGDNLGWTWALVFDGLTAMGEESALADVVGHAQLESAARENLRAHISELRVDRVTAEPGEPGPEDVWMISGSKLAPSMALYLNEFAEELNLDPCAEGYFVCMPSREGIMVIPATDPDDLPALLLSTAQICFREQRPLSPQVWHTDGDGLLVPAIDRVDPEGGWLPDRWAS